MQDSGKKNDQEKNRLDLIHPAVILELGKVLTYGANKYGERNYQKGLAYHRVYGAALRHLVAWWNGENNDRESGLLHLSHCLCNIAFLIEFESNREKYANSDDKPQSKIRNYLGETNAEKTN